MSLSPTRRRAEQFAMLLETGRRSDDPTLAPMVALSGALTAVPAPAAREEFRTALRQRLVAVATVQGVGEIAPTRGERAREVATGWRFQRRVALLAGSAATLTAVAGVGIGASRSLPGDAFYGLKRTTESVQLALTQGQEAKGKRHLEFARTRLAEVRDLAGRSQALPDLVPGHFSAAGPLAQSDSSQIVSTLHDMDVQTRDGANDLMNVYRASGSIEPLRALDTFTQEQYSELLALLPSLPADAQARATQSLELLRVVAVRTVALAPAQPGAPGASGAPTPASGTPSTTPQPAGTSSSGPSPTTTPAPSGGGSTTQLPTIAPTIPPLPSSPAPVPTVLPTILPTLPDLTSPPALPVG